VNEKLDYVKILNDNYISEKCNDSSITRLSYLGDFVFLFTTYDREMSELFARKAIEVCSVINTKTTYVYIKDKENYMWYLMMCNFPFFSKNINWGTSIRGAWWEVSEVGMCFCDLILNGESIIVKQKEWDSFVGAIIDFSLITGDDS
jgi:hypothetical protein